MFSLSKPVAYMLSLQLRISHLEQRVIIAAPIFSKRVYDVVSVVPYKEFIHTLIAPYLPS